MIKEVHIVVYECGSYDDFSSKNIAVYTDRQRAEDFCSFKNEAIQLVEQFSEQIPINEALSDSEFPSEQDKIDTWIEESQILFEKRTKYNLEQMQILVEKSSCSKEMKEEILKLFENEWGYLNSNKYSVQTLSITE